MAAGNDMHSEEVVIEGLNNPSTPRKTSGARMAAGRSGAAELRATGRKKLAGDTP